MVQAVMCAEIDMTSIVATVHDGDTFILNTGEKVRLADLNAPELGEPGSYEARDYLDSLVCQHTVYLDVDDRYQTDIYERLVCVVYVDYNSTHLLNVNKALIDGGYAEARNYNNEFNYDTFMLYVPRSIINQTAVDNVPLSLLGMAVVFALIILVFLLMILKRR
jgi:micrococcal nuclease